jgi:para-nitrobenzyl esterase
VTAPGAAIAAHLGIRFAEPPVGARRWRPPAYVGDARPLGTWAPDCPQPADPARTRAPGQDEDCLFLNVWAPAAPPPEPLPVLVWFYGGSFLFGSASDPACDGAALAARGAVVVTAAYRVGLLGYLAHPALSVESPHGSSGNYGLLDQLAALRWVRERIADFGGDPARVTPFGVSAGSASLALLQTSPLAAGAFDRLILQSPGAFRPLAPVADAEAAALAAYGPDVERMRAWPAADVLAESAALIPKMRALTAPRLLRPIRDGWVVPTDDRAAYRAGHFHAVPTLVGSNADEGSRLTAAWPIADVAAYRALLDANFGEAAAEAMRHYPADTDADVAAALAAVFGDTQFSFGARGIATAVSARQPATYRYLYSWRAPGALDGPHHGEEVAGLFSGATPPGEAMAAAWVRFAATGDPNGGDLPPWPAATPAGDELLEFGAETRPTAGWRAASLDFLDRYFG